MAMVTSLSSRLFVSLLVLLHVNSLVAQFEGLDSNGVATACNKIMKTMNNSQTEWFEKREWYENAKDTCMALQKNGAEAETATLEGDYIGKACKKMLQAHGGSDRAWHPKALAMCESLANGKSQITLGALAAAKKYSERDGHSVANGCKEMLAAKNNGHDDWFESQAWYQKALKICETLAATNTDDLKLENMAKDGGAQLLKQKLQQAKPGSFAQRSCEKLQAAEASGRTQQLQSQTWYLSALRLCKLVGGAPPEQLAADEDKGESLSGRAIQATCEDFWKSRRNPMNMARVQNEEWYRSTAEMCSGLKDQNSRWQGMNGNDLVRKCQMYDAFQRRVQRPGLMQRQLPAELLERLAHACAYLHSREQKLDDDYYSTSDDASAEQNDYDYYYYTTTIAPASAEQREYGSGDGSEVEICQQCALTFARSGGCAAAARGQDPSQFIPPNCDPCSAAAHQLCRTQFTPETIAFGGADDGAVPLVRAVPAVHPVGAPALMAGPLADMMSHQPHEINV